MNTFATSKRTSRRAGLSTRLSLLGIATLGLTVAAGIWVVTSQGEAEPINSTSGDPADSDPTTQPFASWPTDRKPALALVLSGQTYGYVQPCGCSRPQMGGLERRYNLVRDLRGRGWPVLALDLGDVATKDHPDRPSPQSQQLKKYALTMQAMKLMNYAAVGVGKQEFRLPLLDGLASYTLQDGNEKPRVLGGNIAERNNLFPGADGNPMVGDVEVIAREGQPAVGVVGLVGPSVFSEIQEKINPDIQFLDNGTVLKAALARMKADPVTPQLKVLLYQGGVEEARKAAAAFPELDVILCDSPESEPPGVPTMVKTDNGEVMIIRVGQKGRYVGVVGAYEKPGGGFDLRYELVSLGEDFETPGEVVHEQPVLKLLQDYAKEVRDAGLLKEFPKRKHDTQVKFPKAEYVGSQKCMACHIQESLLWKNSPHSHAYDALVKIADKPTLRQFDGECIVCHTVGFKFETGYVDAETTPHLKDVGCESCHGPASLHVGNPMNKDYLMAMSPWKVNAEDRLPTVEKMQSGAPLTPQEQRTLNLVDATCQSCHDIDNDPHFRLEDEKYWPKIVHTGFRPKLPGQPGNPK